MRKIKRLRLTLMMGMALCVCAQGGSAAAYQTSQEEAQKDSQDQEERRQRDRDRQNIDEPTLRPFFGGRIRQDDDANDQTVDEINDERPTQVVPLKSGFTSILTLLTPEKTDLSLGVGPVLRPDYLGSDDYEVGVDPQVFFKLRNFVFFDDDGADLALFGFSGFRLGPSIRIAGDRDEDENIALTGLGNISETFEFGGFAATTLVNRYSIKFKVRKGISSGHRGLIVDAFGTALLFKYGPFSTSVSAQASWVGNNYANAFFTVTPEQSVNSGLSQFQSRSGFRNIGGSLNGYLNLGQRWSLNPYIQYDRIIGNFRNTPIIADFGSPDQVRVGFHIIRQFRLFEKK